MNLQRLRLLQLHAHAILLRHLIFVGLIATSFAWPNYAGTCGTSQSIKSSGGQHGANGRGGLNEGSLELVYSSKKDIESKITTTPVLAALTEYSTHLTISPNTKASFKGFLIRLEALSEQDISTALTGTSDQSQLSVISCGANVEAITHNSNDFKTSIPFQLYFEDGGNYLLEVTVVVSNQVGERDNWYYSSYNITVTPPPTMSPTKSTVPSNIPSQNPSITPTTTPSIKPTLSANPSGIGSQIPSISSVSRIKGPLNSTSKFNKSSGIAVYLIPTGAAILLAMVILLFTNDVKKKRNNLEEVNHNKEDKMDDEEREKVILSFRNDFKKMRKNFEEVNRDEEYQIDDEEYQMDDEEKEEINHNVVHHQVDANEKGEVDHNVAQ